jgi:hypothetical protein
MLHKKRPPPGCSAAATTAQRRGLHCSWKAPRPGDERSCRSPSIEAVLGDRDGMSGFARPCTGSGSPAAFLPMAAPAADRLSYSLPGFRSSWRLFRAAAAGGAAATNSSTASAAAASRIFLADPQNIAEDSFAFKMLRVWRVGRRNRGGSPRVYATNELGYASESLDTLRRLPRVNNIYNGISDLYHRRSRRNADKRLGSHLMSPLEFVCRSRNGWWGSIKRV